MPDPWALVRSVPGPSYKILSLRTDTARSPRTGREHDFYIIESRDWVNIIPLTDDNQVVMVRQFRHGVRAFTLELPGGLVEDGNEPAQAAYREMVEETGYEAERVIPLGVCHPQPALLNNRCHTFLATRLKQTGRQSLDAGEDIQVVLVPLQKIPALIREGVITHALVQAAFYQYFLRQQPDGVPR